jgi:hypothetical protein
MTVDDIPYKSNLIIIFGKEKEHKVNIITG